MIKQAILNQAIVGIIEDINQRYLREATRKWDLGEADIPVFGLWVKAYVNSKWWEMVQRN